MATTNFTDQVTVVEASWLNDVDEITYPSTSKTSAHNNDEFILRDSQAAYVPKKYTYTNFKADVWAFFGALIAAGTSKTTPVDADSIALCDSAASNVTKKLTIANLKTAIAPTTGTYAPTLTGISNVTTITTLSASTWSYYRIGNYVTVTGAFTVTPTATNTTTTFSATLPVASTLSTAYLNGVGAMGEYGAYQNQAVYISENGAPSSTAYFAIKSTASAGADTGRFTFTYLVA